MKKHIAVILAFVIAISTFGIIGAACTKQDVNQALATDVLAKVVEWSEEQLGYQMPAAIKSQLNSALVEKIAAKTGYMGICTFVCDFIAEKTGIVIPPAKAALLVAAVKLIITFA